MHIDGNESALILTLSIEYTMMITIITKMNTILDTGYFVGIATTIRTGAWDRRSQFIVHEWMNNESNIRVDFEFRSKQQRLKQTEKRKSKNGRLKANRNGERKYRCCRYHVTKALNLVSWFKWLHRQLLSKNAEKYFIFWAF